MEIIRISKGGQISIPASIRKRWGVARLILDDRGEEVAVIPLPDDPIRAARGMFKGTGVTADEAMRELREEEAEAERRKWGDAE